MSKHDTRQRAVHMVRWCGVPLGPNDRALVCEALGKRILTNGGRVREFEERFGELCGGGEAVATSSCMGALHLAALVLGLRPGDEVIVPALTHVAAANAVVLVGATPRFVDIHPSSGNLDNNLIEAALTPRTRAIFLQHHTGLPAYMGSTLDIARRHDLAVVEDCATALGSTHSGKHVGLLGDIGCFSFHPKKHITTGEGGMLLTKHVEMAEKARRLRSFGYGDDAHQQISSPGLNYRMTEFQAVMGIVQVERFAEQMGRRMANLQLLRRMLGHLPQLGSHYCFTFVVPDGQDRNKMRHQLAADDIETSIHYPAALPDLDWYRRHCPQPHDDFLNARYLASRTISLPVGPHLAEVHIRRMAEAVLRIIDGCGKAA